MTKRSARGELLLAAAAAASTLALGSHALADSTWVGGGGNQYMDNAANWDNGIPTGAIANFGALTVNTSAESDMGVSFLGMNIDNSGIGKWTITRSGNGSNPRTITIGASGLTATGSGTITWGAFNTIIATNQEWNIAEGLTIANENIAQMTFTGTLTKTGLGTLVLGSGGLGSGGIVVNEGILASTRSTTPLGTGGITLSSGTLFDIRSALVSGTPVYLNGGSRILSSGAGAGLDTGSNVNLLTNGTTVTLSTGALTTDTMRMRSVVLGGDNTNVIQVNGAGVLSLEGGTNAANAFAGKWVINSGVTVKAHDIFALGNRSGAASTTNVANPTQIELAGGTLSLAGTDSSSTAINFNNPVLVSANSRILLDRQSAGTGLIVGNSVSRKLGNMTIGAQSLTVSAGTNVTSVNAGSEARLGVTTLTLTGNPTFNVVNTGVTVGFEMGTISGSGFGLTKAGNGVMRVTGGTSNYSGNTTITGGKMAFGTIAVLSSPEFTFAPTSGNTAMLELNNGAGSPTWTFRSGLKGTGTLQVTGGSGTATLNMQGVTIAPGTATTAGMITISPTATTSRAVSLAANSGALSSIQIDILSAGTTAGVDHDQVVLGPTALLNGNLRATNLVLTVDDSILLGDVIGGQRWKIVDAPAVTFTGYEASPSTLGFFSTTIDPEWSSRLKITYESGGIFAQLPEPGSLSLVALAGLGLIQRRRRKPA